MQQLRVIRKSAFARPLKLVERFSNRDHLRPSINELANQRSEPLDLQIQQLNFLLVNALDPSLKISDLADLLGQRSVVFFEPLDAVFILLTAEFVHLGPFLLELFYFELEASDYPLVVAGAVEFGLHLFAHVEFGLDLVRAVQDVLVFDCLVVQFRVEFSVFFGGVELAELHVLEFLAEFLDRFSLDNQTLFGLGKLKAKLVVLVLVCVQLFFVLYFLVQEVLMQRGLNRINLSLICNFLQRPFIQNLRFQVGNLQLQRNILISDQRSLRRIYRRLRRHLRVILDLVFQLHNFLLIKQMLLISFLKPFLHEQTTVFLFQKLRLQLENRVIGRVVSGAVVGVTSVWSLEVVNPIRRLELALA